MFKQIRYANVKIKEFYDCKNDQDIKNFKKRVATLIDEGKLPKMAAREVVAIEPNYVYVVVSGLHGNVYNDNGDYFRWDELLKKKEDGRYTFETWVGKPSLTNHDPNAVVGQIIDAWPIQSEKSIDFLHRVDEKLNFNLVKGIRNGSVTGTSMGVLVGHSYCNICENLAHDESEWCFVPDTEVLLDDYTTKKIEDIRCGDEVTTHTGKSQKVTKLYKRHVNEDICNIRISGEYRPLRVTKNHPVLALLKDDIHCRRDSKQSVCATAQFSICTRGGHECQHKVSEEINDKEYKFVEAGKLSKGDWLLTPVIADENEFYDSEEISKLLGWYLAEGCLNHKSQRLQGVEFSINQEEVEFIKSIYKACETELDYTPRTHDSKIGKSRSVRVSDGGYLAKICHSHCGEYAKFKKLSKELLQAPKKDLITFLKAYIEGDGYTPVEENGNIKKISMETASKQLANQLMYLCDKLGLHATIMELENEPTELVPAKDLLIYRVAIAKVGTRKLYNIKNKLKNLSGRYIYQQGVLYRLRRINSVKTENYEGIVHNLEVEGDNSYVANNMAVHNCDHLSPNKLNIKGKLYTGQDNNNKYFEKIGIICYEDNRDLEGVEDSFITLGEPADSKALTKTVLASATSKGNNSDMSGINDKSSINARRADMLSNRRAGIREIDSSKVVHPSGGAGNMGEANPKLLNRAIVDLMRKKGLSKDGKSLYASGSNDTYESSREVIKAIDAGEIKKQEALNYVEQFGLVTAEKLEDLTVASAYQLLKADVYDEQVHEDLLTKVASEGGGDQAISESDASPEESQPTPEGTVAPSAQMPSSNGTGDQASDTNKSTPDEKQPAYDGSVAPKTQMPGDSDGGSQAGEMNKSKPEENQPTPTTAMEEPHSSDLALSESDAPTEEDQPDPSDKSQTTGQPGSDTSDLAISESDAPVEPQPDPIKAQFEAEDNGEGEEEEDDKPEEKEEDKEEEKDEKKDYEPEEDKPEEDKPEEEKEATPADKLEEAIELLKDIKPEVSDEPMAEEAPAELPPLPEEVTEELPPLPEEGIPEELPPLGEGEMYEMPEMPLLGYKVELVKDAKSPADSYYVVSLKKAPVFSVTARQAWGKSVKSNLDVFMSDEYASALKTALNKKGAKKVYKSQYGSLGIILAQNETLPEDTFVEPAPPMNLEEEPMQDITNDDKATNYSDLILEVLSTVLAENRNVSPEDVVNELQTTFSSEDQANKFAGILQEKYEKKQIEKAPEAEISLDEGEGAYAPGTATEELPTDMGELQGFAKKLQAKLVGINKLLPDVKTQLKEIANERDAYKAKLEKQEKTAKLKARVSYTKDVANRKLELGLIKEGTVNEEALRLAKLSDENLKIEVKELENSIKIARKISKTKDYSNTEEGTENKREAVGTVLASVPSQIEESTEETKTYTWSKGF